MAKSKKTKKRTSKRPVIEVGSIVECVNVSPVRNSTFDKIALKQGESYKVLMIINKGFDSKGNIKNALILEKADGSQFKKPYAWNSDRFKLVVPELLYSTEEYK